MPKMTDEQKSVYHLLDAHLDYPSDRLTLRQLRMLWPDPDALDFVIRDLRILEGNVAQKAFMESAAPSTAGAAASTPGTLRHRDEECQELTDLYVQTGLASGPYSAAEALRRLEAQARSLAPHQPGWIRSPAA